LVDTWVQYGVAAAATASVYSLISLGITMIFGVARIMHVAHALFFLLAAFLTAELVTRGWPYAAATAASVAGVTVLGGVVYLLVFARLRDRPFSSLIVGLGLVVVGEALLHRVWGVDIYSIPGLLAHTHTVAGISFTTGAVVSVAAAAALMGALAYVLRRTDAGRMMRAVAENPSAARLLGVRAQRVAAGVFLAGTAMAAVAGSLIGTFVPFSSASANVFVLKAFAIAIVGGLGSPVGAVVASVLFALAEIVPIANGHAQWSQPALFFVLVLALVVRPNGLFGKPGSHHAAGDDGVPIRLAARVRSRAMGWNVAALVVLVALAIAPTLSHSESFKSVVAYGLCLAIVAYAVWFPLHYLGVPSLAHAALFGVGAYAAVVVMQHSHAGLVVQFAAAVAACAAVAFVMALVSMRLRGLPSIAIVTLALGGLTVSLLSNMTSITGGVAGKTITAPLRVLGKEYGPAASTRPVYVLALIVVALTLAVAWAMQRMAFGTKLLAVRDSANLAESVGINTYWHRVAVFSAAGALAGFAGVLYAYFNRFLEPATFGEGLAINLLLAVLIGGVASIYGPLAGVAVFIFLPRLSPFGGEVDLALYGIALILIATFAPAGVTAWFDVDAWRARLGRIRRREPAEQPSVA
jgi:branched-chain amino acid transport system permease protein